MLTLCQFVLAVAFVAVPTVGRADPRLGLSPCALLAPAPTPTHPLRRVPPFAAAFARLDARPFDAAAQRKVFAAFTAARDRLFADAMRAFTFAGDDIAAWDTRAAQRFLANRVLAANAPLRIGRDTIELAPPIAAAMMLAACRAGDFGAAVAEARRTTAEDAGGLRAGALLLLLFAVDPSATSPTAADLHVLAGELRAEAFLDAFVLAEIALRSDDPARARELNAAARTLATTADQHEAWLHQQKRLP